MYKNPETTTIEMVNERAIMDGSGMERIKPESYSGEEDV